MAEITLARVDHRLIHGQVVTKWLKIAMAKKIIIIDDYLAKETFMVDVYKMAAPSGVDVEIYSVEKALEEYNKNNFGNGNGFLLFKNVDMAYKTFKVGINYGKLQLGGIPSGAGKKMVFTAVSLDEKEVEQLLEMQENNFKIDLHIVPEENSITLDEAVKKFRG